MKIAAQNRTLLLAIALSFGAAGAIYWPLASGRIDLTSQSFISKWAIPALICGFVGSFYLLKQQTLKVIIATLAGMEIAVFANVVFELLQDPSSHNLWPFEIMITGATALPFLILASILGSIISKMLGNRQP